MLRRCFTLILLALPGCGSGMKTQQLPDGTWKVTCKSSLAECTRRAPAVCGDAGHHVVGGGSENKVYGTPGNQVAVGVSEVIVACEGTAGTPVTPPASQTHVCTPGSTLRCYGPGACTGGQACLPDGSGFGPCDCGPGAPPEPALAGDAGSS